MRMSTQTQFLQLIKDQEAAYVDIRFTDHPRQAPARHR